MRKTSSPNGTSILYGQVIWSVLPGAVAFSVFPEAQLLDRVHVNTAPAAWEDPGQLFVDCALLTNNATEPTGSA